VRHALTRTLALAGLLVAGPAVATESSPDDSASAEALFREARSLVNAGDYSDACPKFAESLRLDHAPGTLLSLADCEEHTRRIATAWGHFRELSRELPSTDERRPFAAQRAMALAPRLPHLTIRSSVGLSPGAEIWRDDVQIARASLDTALPVDPGTHTVVVTDGDRVLCRVEVEVREGQSGILAAESSGHEVTRPTWSATKTAGWIAGGLAVTALATGTYFGISALSNRSASDAGCTAGVCSNSASAREYDDARSQARIADVAFGIGLVSTAVASYLLFFRSRNSDSPPVSNASLASLWFGTVVW
jgi:hypothetical protein